MQSPELRTRLARLSHDFDNLLMVIAGHAELARQSLPLAHPARNSIDLITVAAELARALADTLHGPDHPHPRSHSPFALTRVVEESAQLIRGMMREVIEVEVDTTTGAGLWVVGDAGQLQRALLNLADNARYAMGDKGRLSIHLRTVRGPGDKPVAELVVADTGIGIPDEEQAHLFDPFFSTKSSGTRRGFGLWQVRDVVNDHGGTVSVWSRAGCGTRFTIALPTCAPQEPSGEPTQPGQVIAQRSVGVLVIEPDNEARHLITASLRSAGYHVVAVTDHRHARHATMTTDRAVRAAVVDVDELDSLRDVDLNELRAAAGLDGIVLLASDPDVARRGQSARDQLLLKPFRMDALRASVARMLLDPGHKDPPP